MTEDIKSLIKKNTKLEKQLTDLEKRLKVAEAKIRVFADSITSAKDIEKYIEVVSKEQKVQELRNKAEGARIDEAAKREKKKGIRQTQRHAQDGGALCEAGSSGKCCVGAPLTRLDISVSNDHLSRMGRDANTPVRRKPKVRMFPKRFATALQNCLAIRPLLG